MNFQVHLSPSGHHYTCETGQDLLDAALCAGLNVPYGCKNGACGACKCKVNAGQISQGAHQEHALSAQEAAAGWALMCCATPLSDLTLEVREVQGTQEYPVKKMPCRVARLEKLAADVMHIELQLPANERLAYRAGQFIEFILPGGQRRSYSMACAPGEHSSLSLHVRHMPGGLFTDSVFTQLKVRDILRIEGPHGSFFLREDSPRPLIFLASGTGFAPIKAMVEHWIQLGARRPLTLYWGARRPADVYQDALCQQWAAQYPALRYIPVVSDALPEDGWNGRSGWVHTAVLDDFASLAEYDVYACGAPAMVFAAQRDFLTQRALPAEQFFADAFLSARDAASPASNS